MTPIDGNSKQTKLWFSRNAISTKQIFEVSTIVHADLSQRGLSQIQARYEEVIYGTVPLGPSSQYLSPR